MAKVGRSFGRVATYAAGLGRGRLPKSVDRLLGKVDVFVDGLRRCRRFLTRVGRLFARFSDSSLCRFDGLLGRI